MSYCLNPRCPKPRNPDDAMFCQQCGKRLLLGDRYRAIKLIGQGGFGKTFLAVDEAEPGAPDCVIKQSLARHQTNLSPERTVELFRREAEQLAQLGRHPQIPALLDHLEEYDSQYLVQEFIDGQNLELALKEHGPFDEAEIRQVLGDLLPVLQFIHDRQVIHRDIKPENIICPYTGDRLVLVDFGASKSVTQPVPRTGTVIGSAGYVAPEQAMGKAEFASDLYSLGVTCIHLLTAMHPFDLYSPSEDGWVWGDYLVEPISDRLRRVLTKLLQRPTNQRYRTATAVLRDLGMTSRLPQSSTRAPREARPEDPGGAIARIPEPGRLEPRRLEPGRASKGQNANGPNAKGQLAIAPPRSWHCVHTLTGHGGSVTAVALSPDGSLVASGSVDKSIKLWSLPDGTLLHTFAGQSLWFGAGHSDRISALAFTGNGQALISSSDDGTLKQWDLGALKLSHTLPCEGWGIAAIALGRDSPLLAVGGGDGTIHLWNLDTQEMIANLSKHREPVSALALSPLRGTFLQSDGQLLASSGEDGSLRLWDVRDNTLVNTWRGHGDPISAIAATPEWRTLISGSWDKTLKVWDVPSGELLRTLSSHADRVTCLAVSPTPLSAAEGSGWLVASGSDDSSIALWRLQREFGDRPAIIAKRFDRLKHAWAVNALSFSHDGQWLASGSSDETLKLWRRG